MVNILRRCLPLLLVFASGSAIADSWIRPTPEELKMTVEPAAPNAAAIYLFRDERDDDKFHMQSLYVRLKILTEDGKKYADVELGYEQSRSFSIRAIEGRTIHSDGTVIPFAGGPYDKMVGKTKTVTYKAKVFTLPDVQVGSILEYRYSLAYEDHTLVAPQWYIQQPLYVRKAHYEFVPSDFGVNGEHGGVAQNAQDAVSYTPVLPKGFEVVSSLTATERVGRQAKTYSLEVEKIDALPDENHMPPIRSFSYRVLFYYTAAKSADEFWKMEGKYWSHSIDSFMSVGKLGAVAGGIVAPSDTPTQKAQKIYDAVMTVENTSFTRGHTRAEDKAEGIKTRNAEDIWAAKRGDADEIVLLYVGLARAAGLQAYVAEVTNRDEAFFVPGFLSMRQLNDYIAIVSLDGKELFLDPGERYCPFGDLHWKHTRTGGLRQTEHGTEIVQTPAPGYKTTTVLRTADLYVDANGKVHGNLRITMTGSEALRWRQRALSTDEEAIKKDFEDHIETSVPPGIEVKTNHFLGLADYDKPFMVVLSVSGTSWTATARRMFMPATFFEAGSKPLFVEQTRTVPVELDYPYQVQDNVTFHLPKTLAVESAPKDAQIPLSKNAAYQATFKQEPGTLESGRAFVLAVSFFSVEEYPAMKDFFQKVNAKDQEQAVLQPAAAPSGGTQ